MPVLYTPGCGAVGAEPQGGQSALRIRQSLAGTALMRLLAAASSRALLVREDQSDALIWPLEEGWSLHRACQAQMHVDRSLNVGLYFQALDRTRRVGLPEGRRAMVTGLLGPATRVTSM
jgi:hypothetical protein